MFFSWSSLGDHQLDAVAVAKRRALGTSRHEAAPRCEVPEIGLAGPPAATGPSLPNWPRQMPLEAGVHQVPAWLGRAYGRLGAQGCVFQPDRVRPGVPGSAAIAAPGPSSTLLGRSEGGGEPAGRDGLPAQGAGAEDEGQEDVARLLEAAAGLAPPLGEPGPQSWRERG
jgi:hypothetical protein